eukprot:1196279-Prorocentrum_minimum.AAC.8
MHQSADGQQFVYSSEFALRGVVRARIDGVPLCPIRKQASVENLVDVHLLQWILQGARPAAAHYLDRPCQFYLVFVAVVHLPDREEKDGRDWPVGSAVAQSDQYRRAGPLNRDKSVEVRSGFWAHPRAEVQGPRRARGQAGKTNTYDGVSRGKPPACLAAPNPPASKGR